MATRSSTELITCSENTASCVARVRPNGHTCASCSERQRRRRPMANHLTPTELAARVRLGTPRRDRQVRRAGRPDLQRSDRQDPVPLQPARARAPAHAPQVASASASRGGPAAVRAATARTSAHCSADWRSSVEVVCSRILRQARVVSRSASKCLTTLRTRVAEISIAVPRADALEPRVVVGELQRHRLEAVPRDVDARGEVHDARLEHQLVVGLGLDQDDVDARIALLPTLWPARAGAGRRAA